MAKTSLHTHTAVAFSFGRFAPVKETGWEDHL